MLCLALALPLAAPHSFEPIFFLSEVFVRQEGPDTGEYIRWDGNQSTGPGPVVAVVDGSGILVGLWDFSTAITSDYTIIIGGPSVANRTFDLAAGVGPAVSGNEDFLPDGTQTIYQLGRDAAYLAYVHSLVGTDVDPDGDGRTLLFDPSVTNFTPSWRIALVDGRWPIHGRVYDCPSVVGPDGADAPAGAFLGPP